MYPPCATSVHWIQTIRLPARPGRLCKRSASFCRRAAASAESSRSMVARTIGRLLTWKHVSRRFTSLVRSDWANTVPRDIPDGRLAAPSWMGAADCSCWSLNVAWTSMGSGAFTRMRSPKDGSSGSSGTATFPTSVAGPSSTLDGLFRIGFSTVSSSSSFPSCI